MSHFSSEGDSDVEGGQVARFSHLAKSSLEGKHCDRWYTGIRPVEAVSGDLTSPEEASECNRSVSEHEMGFLSSGGQRVARELVTLGASKGFPELLSPDETISSEADDDPFGLRRSTVASHPTHQTDYRAGLSHVAPLNNEPAYTRVPEEGRWNEAEESAYPMEQPLVKDLEQYPSEMEYNPPPSVGEYPQPPSVGDYSQPPSVGEYPQPPSVGDYSQPPSVGEYTQPPSVGEYPQPPSVGGYPQPPLVERSYRPSHIGASRGGKEWDVFVSHSTGDKPWARERIIIPLRNPPLSLKVSGSYHFMPDESRYDNKAIECALRRSAVVIIGLSPSYLKSERCTKEWQLVSRLGRERRCRVILGAVQGCNRPEELKRYLYLDFLDQRMEKREAVWEKLINTLRGYLQVERGVPMETDHSEKEAWVEEDHRGEHTWASAGGERRAGGEEKSSSGSSEGEEEEEEEGEVGEDIPHVMEGAANYEEFAKDFENPSLSYEIPMDQMNAPVFHDNMQAVRCSNNAGSEAKQMESGSEEGEIADDEPDEQERDTEVAAGSHAVDVARHYNALEAPNMEKRKESPIFHMRNFNNWVKSVLIRTYLEKLKSSTHCTYVLDLCCGKGGDLLKWKEGSITHLVCADIAETSVQQCRERYKSDKMSRRSKPFEAEFIVADCTKVRLRDEYENKAMRFNLTSCQFSVHYSFESQPQAHMMLRNACENLRPGGYFIGTTVDSSELVHRVRTSKHGTIGNEIFSVTPRVDVWKPIPLFGAMYDFRLHGVVDLPEYLVYFPLLVEMLKDFNMEHVCHQNFYDFFTEHRNNADDVELMYKMQAMDRKSGSMSPDEWEAIGLYMVFVFRKEASSGGGLSGVSDTRKRSRHHQDYYY